MREKTYKSGEVIFKEGEVEFSMYDLLQGKVGIYVNYGKPEEKLLTELEAKEGALFGEMALLERMSRSATAVALEEVQVAVIDGNEFATYFSEKPERIYAVMAQMGKRIRALNQDYNEACRAAAELVGEETSDEEQSSWLKEQLKKIAGVLNMAGKER